MCEPTVFRIFRVWTALENLSKEDLIKVISSRDEALAGRDKKIGYLGSQLAMYKRMQFGQKRERFEGDPNQTALPFEAGPVEVEQQRQETKENIRIPSSTIEGWTREALIKLEPLYDQLVFDTKAKCYLQVDETPIKVLESDRKGAAHQGWYWVYHSPLDRTVLFDYDQEHLAKEPDRKGDGLCLCTMGCFVGLLI